MDAEQIEQAPSTAIAKKADLPEAVSRRGITEPQWVTLAKNLYPGANPTSVLMVWDYCKARNLDPMKKPVHIVQMDVRLADGTYEKRDVVLPGIYEYRITAHRTGEYLGHEKPVYGDVVKFAGVEAPSSCEYTAYRWNPKAHMKVPYTVEVFFAEVVATKRDGTANQRWARAPKQMLTKCAEAAALREAFPEEIGGEPTAEEMDGHSIVDVTPDKPMTGFDRLPETLRDRVEVAFSTLKLTPAQRLTRINEFLGSDAVPEEGAEKLLQWARDEFRKQQEPKAKPASNNKVAKPEAAPAPSEMVNSHKGSLQTLVGAGRDVPPVQDAEVVEPKPEPTVAATEIAWGNQGQPNSEMF